MSIRTIALKTLVMHGKTSTLSRFSDARIKGFSGEGDLGRYC